MCKCPKCGCDWYDVLSVVDTDWIDDKHVEIVRAKCDDCGKEFLVREFYTLSHTENIKSSLDNE